MEPKLPLTITDLKQILPHRYPMLLVDRVTEFAAGERIAGYKNLTANEQFFEGHFPERPMMPGVLMLEALAQLGVVFFKLNSDAEAQRKLIVFAAVESVKFRRPVIPGDVLKMEMTLIKKKGSVWKMSGVGTVDGEKAVEAVLTAAEASEA